MTDGDRGRHEDDCDGFQEALSPELSLTSGIASSFCISVTGVDNCKCTHVMCTGQLSPGPQGKHHPRARVHENTHQVSFENQLQCRHEEISSSARVAELFRPVLRTGYQHVFKAPSAYGKRAHTKTHTDRMFCDTLSVISALLTPSSLPRSCPQILQVCASKMSNSQTSQSLEGSGHMFVRYETELDNWAAGVINQGRGAQRL